MNALPGKQYNFSECTVCSALKTGPYTEWDPSINEQHLAGEQIIFLPCIPLSILSTSEIVIKVD